MIHRINRIPAKQEASARFGQIEFELLRKPSAEPFVEACHSATATNDLLTALWKAMIELGQNIRFARRPLPVPWWAFIRITSPWRMLFDVWPT